MARFLVLGAGFVAEPLVEYLNRREDNHITIAGYTLLESQTLAEKFDNIKAIQMDVADRQALMDIVADFDVVVSLVPAPFHLLIAQVCIHCKVNMVTASYQSAEMLALAKQAEAAGICIMNEIGLDPGIDHLSAMKIIDDAQAKGDEIESFVSWCGGIPAPEDNDNPLGYKFSWEPRGAIMVLLNEAIYQHNKQTIKVRGADLMQWSKPIEIANLDLECYPNRNSVNYKDIYGIDSVKDILRGTLRYRGFCDIFQDIKKLGLMQTELENVPVDITWKDYILGLNKAKNVEELKASINPKSWDALSWVGCFSDELTVSQKDCSLDALCDLFLQRLTYKSDEKDMVVLQHKFVIKKSDGHRYFVTSVLKETGNPQGFSAMAKTVGYPAAMASQLIADGKIQTKGMLLPVTKEIYLPILELLQLEGIGFDEAVLIDQQTSVQQFIPELD